MIDTPYAGTEHRRPERARAFWVVGSGRGEIRDEPLRRPAAGEVLIEALHSGISRGTELLVFRNEVPPSQYAAMRCPFQAGDFPAPVKYGYALVGRVAAGDHRPAGEVVFVLHPHQDRLVVPADAVVTVPEAVPPARAVLAANMETALNGLWDAGVQPGQRVCVFGAGVVGLLTAYLARRIPATEVIIVDPDPARASSAASLGIAFAAAPPQQSDFDVVFEASGNPAALAACLPLAGFEASIVVLSWYGERTAALALGHDFHARRLVIRSSQVGTVAARLRGRRSRQERLLTALGLLADARLDALIAGESRFEDLPAAMAALDQGRPGGLSHRITY